MKALLAVFTAICIFGLFFLVQPSDKAEAAATTPVVEAAVTLEVHGCPTGDTWTEIGSFFVLPSIDKGNFKDQNGDGLLCFRVPDGFCNNRGQGAAAPSCVAWVWKDNTN